LLVGAAAAPVCPYGTVRDMDVEREPTGTYLWRVP